MSERDKFINDIILELSRQKEGNGGVFLESPKLTDPQVFKKMCYSYPLVNASEVQDLSIAVDKITKKQTTSLADTFCLDEVFVDNIRQLSDKVDGTQLAAQQVAAIVFLKFPKHLFACNRRQLSNLFCSYDHDSEFKVSHSRLLRWSEIIARFKTLVFSCSSSYVSELTLTHFSEGFHLVSLLSAISTLDKVIAVTDGFVVDPAEEADALREIEESNDSDYLTLEGVYHRLVKEVFSGSTKVQEESAENSLPAVANTVVGSLKEMWLHLTFIYRDILIRIPALLSSYLPPLCEVLLSATPSAASSSSPQEAAVHLFRAGGAKYPTSSECICALLLSNLSAYLTAEALGSFSDVRLPKPEDSSHVSARGALRDYLTSKQRLSVLVDIWERMNQAPKKPKGAPATPSVVSLNVESCNFLLDVAKVYACDLNNGAYSYSSGRASAITAAKHFEALVTSRLVATLLGVLVSVVRLSLEVASSSTPTVRVASGGTSAAESLSSGLLRFFSLASFHSPAIAQYLQEYPDLDQQLALVATASWGGPVKQLQGAGVISDDRQLLKEVLALFSPAEAVGLLAGVLLGRLTASNSAAQFVPLLHMCDALEKGLALVMVDIRIEQRIGGTDDSSSSSTAGGGSEKVEGDFVLVKAPATSDEEQEEHEEVSEKITSGSEKRDLVHVAAVMDRLVWTLGVLLSARCGAAALRGLYKPIAVTSPESALLLRMQSLFKSFVENALPAVTAQLKELTILAGGEGSEGSLGKLLGLHEALKKQLKAMQGLAQGFSSNKTD